MEGGLPRSRSTAGTTNDSPASISTMTTDHCLFCADSVLAEMQSFLTGDWPTTGSERVLTTVMFADIVGSTARAAEVGDRRWMELLDAYDRFVLRQLDRFRGRHVKSTEDGTLAMLDGPRRAIACAIAIRDGVRALDP